MNSAVIHSTVTSPIDSSDSSPDSPGKIITLGIDFSTQSVSACVLETNIVDGTGRIVMENSVSFRKHSELEWNGD